MSAVNKPGAPAVRTAALISSLTKAATVAEPRPATAPADGFSTQPTPTTKAQTHTPIPSRSLYGEAPAAIDDAAQLQRAIEGVTGRSDERLILSILTRAQTQPGGIGAVLYELSLRNPQLPDKLVRDVVDRSVSDRLTRSDPRLDALWQLLKPGTARPDDRADAVKQLRTTAMRLASRQNPEVRAYVSERLRQTDGALSVFGTSIERLEPKRQSHTTLTEKVMKLGFETLAPEREGDAAKVMQSALVTDASGQPKKLGDVTVLVNGTFNMPPSAALVFRAAQHSGKVVIAGANATGPDALKLRELTEVRGVPVPPELKGKVFAIGNLDPTFMTWAQASDVLVEQLGAMQPMLDGQQTTLVAFSAGALSAVAARKRLADAGHPEVVDRLVTIAGALGGSPFADAVNDPNDLAAERPLASKLGAGVGRMLQTLDPETGRAMFNSTDPETVTAWRNELGLGKELVDLAYVASAEVPEGGDSSKVEALFKLNHALLSKVPQRGDTANDGMVYADQQAYAQRVVKDPVAKTHLQEWKDPATLDVVLGAL